MNIFQTKDEFVTLKQNIQQKPSRFYIQGSSYITYPGTAIDTATSSHGHWEYAGGELKYLGKFWCPAVNKLLIILLSGFKLKRKLFK
jgi:hypothetical protein